MEKSQMKSLSNSYASSRNSEDEVSTRKSKSRNTIYKCCLWTFLIALIILFVGFVLVFVVAPLIFMNSLQVQTMFMFPADKTSNVEYDNFKLYGIEGVRNIYVDVKDEDNTTTIRLGVWHVLPEDYKIVTSVGLVDFDAALNSTEYDVIIYCHGSGGVRVYYTEIYRVLRKFFHVIAVDYRGYGDSTEATMSEKAIVNDLQQLYGWVRTKTSAKIYVWGHSLGTALSTSTVAVLSDRNIVPTGLVLESPFTTMREAILNHPISQIFRWLPWFAATFLDPPEKNGFKFRLTTDVLKVNCPVMILHAEDDDIVPCALGKKVHEVAAAQRNLTVQGNVTYHQFATDFGYNHAYIFKAPELPKYIQNFKDVCEAYNLGKG